MYIELVRKIIELGVEFHAARQGRTKKQILKRIRKHIDSTSGEYRKSQPKIDYEDALCRLGYLYRNVPANATLFRHVLTESDEVSGEIHEKDQGTVNM